MSFRTPAFSSTSKGACAERPVTRGAVELVLDTTEQMARASAFYEANGFSRDDRQIRGRRCTRGYRLDVAKAASPMSSEPRREGYLFGGYLVTQRVARPEAMSAELLPSQLLTASACIANFVPDVWTLSWTGIEDEKRQQAAAALKIAPRQLPALVHHVTAGFNEGRFGWPNIVCSAEALIALFDLLPGSAEWVALGLALHRQYAAAFLEANAPPEGQGAGGVFEMIAKQLALPAGGTVLGFEPLGFEYGGQPHSWLCNGLEKECFGALAIRPRSNGFIGAEDEAARAIAHISKDEVGSEPVQWLPWMVLDYTGEHRGGRAAPAAHLAGRYRALRSVVAVASHVAEITAPVLFAPDTTTTVGIGVTPVVKAATPRLIPWSCSRPPVNPYLYGRQKA